MKTAHQGRGIGSAEFDRVVKHVVDTMVELGVPEDLIKEVGELLIPTKKDIVEE